MKPAIVIPVYSRPNALRRLLGSINRAKYPTDDISLIISLEGGANEEVKELAHGFVFENGHKEVVERKKQLGLRKHILWCGDQSQKYGAVIVLEDDLYVDPYFYHYTQEALNFYKNNENVGGIALYSPRYNENAELPFSPLYNGYSNYFMQVPCSWGQAWTSRQWQAFMDWYKKVDTDNVNSLLEIPEVVKSWPESSWKKYYAAYLAQKDQYFIYPYQSYSTNCGDAGTHIMTKSNKFQVSLGCSKRPLDKFEFCEFDESTVFYDPFMESQAKELYVELGVPEKDLAVDLYGTKPVDLLKKKKYVLTSKQVLKSIKAFRLGLRPFEKVVLDEVEVKRGDSELIHLAKSEDVIKKSMSYYTLTSYLTYAKLMRKEFAFEYIKAIGKRMTGIF